MSLNLTISSSSSKQNPVNLVVDDIDAYETNPQGRQTLGSVLKIHQKTEELSGAFAEMASGIGEDRAKFLQGLFAKINDQNSDLYIKFGIHPIQCKYKDSPDLYLQSILQDKFKATPEEMKNLYQYILGKDKENIVQVVFREELLGSSPEDKEMAAKDALTALQKHPYHSRHFVIKVPPATPKNNTSNLLEFFSLHSIYHRGDELQSIYKAYSERINVGTKRVFTCKCVFRNHELETGKGDTQTKAREDGIKKSFPILEEWINAPVNTYFNALDKVKKEIIQEETGFPSVLVPIVLSYLE